MPTYPLPFAQTNLSDLVARAEAGEEVILARGEGSTVRLVPIRDVARSLGSGAG